MANGEYIRDDRSESFRIIGTVAAVVARERGVAVDTLTLERWRSLMALLRDFDTFADDMGVSNKTAVAELRSFSLFEDNYPPLTPEALTPRVHTTMANRVELILDHGDHIRRTTDVDTFIHHRREEADHTSELLADCATADTVRQPEFYDKFMPTLRSMGRLANYLDTISDYKEDVACEKIAMPASKEFFMALGKQAVIETVALRPVLLNPPIVWQVLKMSKMRLGNRFTHQKTLTPPTGALTATEQ